MGVLFFRRPARMVTVLRFSLYNAEKARSNGYGSRYVIPLGWWHKFWSMFPFTRAIHFGYLFLTTAIWGSDMLWSTWVGHWGSLKISHNNQWGHSTVFCSCP